MAADLLQPALQDLQQLHLVLQAPPLRRAAENPPAEPATQRQGADDRKFPSTRGRRSWFCACAGLELPLVASSRFPWAAQDTAGSHQQEEKGFSPSHRMPFPSGKTASRSPGPQGTDDQHSPREQSPDHGDKTPFSGRVLPLAGTCTRHPRGPPQTLQRCRLVSAGHLSGSPPATLGRLPTCPNTIHFISNTTTCLL